MAKNRVILQPCPTSKNREVGLDARHCRNQAESGGANLAHQIPSSCVSPAAFGHQNQEHSPRAITDVVYEWKGIKVALKPRMFYEADISSTVGRNGVREVSADSYADPQVVRKHPRQVPVGDAIPAVVFIGEGFDQSDTNDEELAALVAYLKLPIQPALYPENRWCVCRARPADHT